MFVCVGREGRAQGGGGAAVFHCELCVNEHLVYA